MHFSGVGRLLGHSDGGSSWLRNHLWVLRAAAEGAPANLCKHFRNTAEGWKSPQLSLHRHTSRADEDVLHVLHVLHVLDVLDVLDVRWLGEEVRLLRSPRDQNTGRPQHFDFVVPKMQDDEIGLSG